MSDKLIKELNIKEQFNLICVDDNIYNINIQNTEILNSKSDKKSKKEPEPITDYTKLPEIQNLELNAPSQDDLLKKLNKYLKTTKDLFKKSEIIHKKTNLEEFKNKKSEDKTIVGFNKIKFDKINDQIQALESNYTLEVLKETFNEHVEVKKPVHIIANTTASINCDSNDALTCCSYNAIFENFTFSYRGNDEFSAAKITSGNATFINCEFTSSKFHSVKVENSSKATFIGCRFTGSPQSNIFVEGNASVTLTNCKIYGAKSYGIELSGKSAANVKQCEIHTSTNGVSISDNASAFFDQCKVHTNTKNGFCIKSKSNNIILQSNEISEHLDDFPIFIDNSNVKLISNTITNNQTAISAVNCSTVTTIRNKFTKPDSSSDKDFVVIGKSSKFDSKFDVYEGDVRNSIFIGGKDSEFVGDNITFRDNNIGNGFYVNPQSKIKITNSHFFNIGLYCFCTISSNDQSKSAKITIQNCDFSSSQIDKLDDQKKQVAILISDRAKFTVDNCKFSNLKRAIAMKSSSEDSSIKNCTFENMSNCAIDATSSSNAVFEKCTISNSVVIPDVNVSVVGKIQSDDNCIKFVKCTFSKGQKNISISQKGVARFEDCTFKESESQSVEIGDGGNVSFDNCLFRNNRFLGLLVTNNSKANVENSSFFANSFNGFVCERKSSLTLKNSKVYDHKRAGGGTIRSSSKCVIDNTEFYGNFSFNLELNTGSDAEITNSNIHSSAGMTSIYVHEESVLVMSSTNIHDESSTAIHIETNSSVTMTKCGVYNCHNSGINFVNKDVFAGGKSANSRLALKECHIHHNSPFGVVYFAGKLTLEKCKFDNNVSGDIGKYEGIKDFSVDPSEQIKVVNLD